MVPHVLLAIEGSPCLTVASAITVGSVYGYLKKPLKSLCVTCQSTPPTILTLHYLLRWSPGKNPNNTVHVDDVAGASWACAEWMATLGLEAANSRAGEQIYFHNDKKKVKEVEGMSSHDQKLSAPLFNLVETSVLPYASTTQTFLSYRLTIHKLPISVWVKRSVLSLEQP